MKKWMKIVGLLLFSMSLTARAAQEGDFIYVSNGSSIRITGYTGIAGTLAVTVPSYIEGLPVVRISASVFNGRDDLESITLPDTLTSIGDSAFRRCERLTGIEIPASVTNIEDCAFQQCLNLKNVTIPAGVVNINYSVFTSCGLTNITLPNSVTNIAQSAFKYCARLPNITIPASVASIGDFAFAQCTDLTAVYFYGNAPSLVGINAAPFYQSYPTIYRLSNATDWPEVPNRWADRPTAFWGSAPPVDTPTILPDGGTNQSSVQVTLACTTAGATIRYTTDGNDPTGSSTEYISDDGPFTLYSSAVVKAKAFKSGYNDSGIASASFTITATPPVVPFTYTTNLDNTITITGYTGSGGAVAIPSIIDGKPVAIIGDGAFDNCTGVTSITIPDSVVSIGTFTFFSCSSLTNLIIGSNVTRIGSDAFGGCSSLTRVNIPNSVIDIGFNAFFDCTGLTSVTIGNGVAMIEDATFFGCTRLTNIIIGTNVSFLGLHAFARTGLVNVTIPDSVANINGSFDGCESLTNITIGAGVTNINTDYTFHGCIGLISITVNSLNSVYSSVDGVLFNKNQAVLIQYPKGKAGNYTIPSSVADIGSRAFQSCRGLTSVTIPSSVTNIGEEAFNSSTGLTRVVIGDSVRSIGAGTFAGCQSLTEVIVGSNVTGIAALMFSYCSLTNIIIPASVSSIGNYAFYNCSIHNDKNNCA